MANCTWCGGTGKRDRDDKPCEPCGSTGTEVVKYSQEPPPRVQEALAAKAERAKRNKP